MAVTMIAATIIRFAMADTPSESNSAWGTVFNPAGRCKVAIQADRARMVVPGGVYDFSGMNGRKNAPRILRNVDGDFIVSVKVTGEFKPGKPSSGSNTFPFVSAGLLLWESNDNYLRLERDTWTDEEGEHWSYTPLFEYWKNGRNLKPAQGTVLPYFKGTNTWLRLTRSGERIKAEISHDGVDWIAAGTAMTQFGPGLQLGVMAINTSTQPHEVVFSEFSLIKPRRNRAENNELNSAWGDVFADILKTTPKMPAFQL